MNSMLLRCKSQDLYHNSPIYYNNFHPNKDLAKVHIVDYSIWYLEQKLELHLVLWAEPIVKELLLLMNIDIYNLAVNNTRMMIHNIYFNDKKAHIKVTHESNSNHLQDIFGCHISVHNDNWKVLVASLLIMKMIPDTEQHNFEDHSSWMSIHNN